jgi:hypothetical protein
LNELEIYKVKYLEVFVKEYDGFDSDDGGLKMGGRRSLYSCVGRERECDRTGNIPRFREARLPRHASR